MEINAYNFAVAATTAVAFTSPSIPLGVASAILVTATLSSGITLTLPNGSTVALGNQTIGTLIQIRCTMATFAAGTCVALA